MTAIKHELALFHPGVKEKSVQSTSWINYRSVSQITNSSAIEFNVSGTTSDYILLSKTRLYLRARIVKVADGSVVNDTDDVTFANLAMHSFFRQVDILLNQKLLTSGVGVNYPYKSMIDVLLNYGHDVKDSLLQSEGYHKDSAFSFDSNSNPGHTGRKNWTKHGLVDFEGPLHCDVAQQEKAILNGVQITIKLFQHDDSFRLFHVNGEGYRMELDDAVLKVCNIKVNPSVTVAQNEVLTKTPAVYPLWRSDIKTFSVAKGSFTFSVDDIFHGLVPARLFVALVSSSAYSGNFAKNPFNFWHYHLNYLELAVDGNSVPTVAFQPNYQDDPVNAGRVVPNGYIHEFASAFSSRYPQAEGNWIKRDEFPGGYCMYVFDVKPGVDDNLFCMQQSGHTRLNARFIKELPEPVTVIAYGLFASEFKIDQVRNVILT